MTNSALPTKRPSSLGWLVRTLLLVCGATYAGCAGRSRTENPFDSEAQASQVRIVVINNDFNDATLFVVGSGERRRLGVVTGKTEESYVIPWRMTGPLHLEITILTGGSCTTPQLQVDPGDVLELQIMNDAARGGQCSGLRGRG